MLYASSPDLRGLTAVVMDEIHYLADRFRGAVWEEVILHLPPEVQVVGLSATVSNAEEFGAWLREVRGETEVVVDEIRPVPLWQHMVVGRRLYDLFGAPSGALVGSDNTRANTKGTDGVTPPFQDGATAAMARIDPVLLRAVRDAEATADRFDQPRGRGRFRNAAPRWRPPGRVDVIERLDGAGLLPAITFVFSRAGCDAAVAAVRALGAAAGHRRGAHPDPGDRGSAHRRTGRAVRRRPVRAGLLGVAGGAGTRHRGASRRPAPGVQGDRRGAVRLRPGQGGLRHRDARARNQHARAHRRAGEAGQVQR